MRHGLLLTMILCLVGCKTHRQTQLQTDLAHQYQATYLATQIMQLQVTDSIREKITRILSGHLTIWSQPDTTGHQHRVADLDFNIDTKKEKDQTTQTNRQDTTTIHANQNHEEGLTFSYTDEKQSDTRLWNGKFLTILIAILFACFLISLYKKQKE